MTTRRGLSVGQQDPNGGLVVAAGVRAGPSPKEMLPLQAIAVGVIFSLLWSSAFAAAKVAVTDAPPLLLLTMRFLLSGVIAVAVAVALGQRMPRDRRTWIAIGSLGLCQNALYLGLIFFAVREVPSALAAIIASALPLVVATVGAAFGRDRPSRSIVIGLACGFSGVITVLYERISGGASLLGIGLCLVALGALSFATLTVNRARFDDNLLMVVGLQMLVGSLALAPLGLALESVSSVRPTPELAISFIYLALVPGLLATFVWFRLIRRIGPTRASVFHFLNPGFAVGISWLVLDEAITWGTVAGVALVAVGILLVQTSRPAERAL